MEKACLVLSDGTVFEGNWFGEKRETICEVVFGTGLTGYVELLTDPSFAGQAVTMASPIVGNYGVFEDVSEATHPWVGALIVRDLTHVENDQRQAEDLDSYLKRNHIPGIFGIDTRGLTLLLRERGTMMGLLTSGSQATLDVEAALAKIEKQQASAFVPMVSRKSVAVFPAGSHGWTKESTVFGKENNQATALAPDFSKQDEAPAFRIALLDFGVKQNIIWNLTQRGCEVTAYPWDTPAEEILKTNPDGIFLSNGPGNPKDCMTAVEEIKKLFASGIPMMGICLGHQLIALATGADTLKLRYGHRGANHPVKDLRADRVYITSQNHSYVVSEDTINFDLCEISHINLNDGSIEGLRYKNKPVFSVQYHPEGTPGPEDNNYLFGEFISLIENAKETPKREQ